MKLSKYLRPGLIVLDLKAETKWEAIDELLAVLVRRGLVADAARAREDLITREKRMSTGMEEGLAIPHTKTTAVSQLIVALGTKREGLEFESLDGKPAHVIFLVLSRKDVSGPHIQCLAQIASLYAKPDVRAALVNAHTAEEVVRILERG